MVPAGSTDAPRLAAERPDAECGACEATRVRIAIIGAGISGLSLGQRLREHGLSPVLFDKGRRPGGRVATRRGEQQAFDHGAQYFTVRTPELQRWIERWVAEGRVAPWAGEVVELADDGPRPARAEDTRWVGTPGMSAVAQGLAEGLDVRVSTRIVSMEAERTLRDESDAVHGPFDRVLVTVPPVQATPLLGAAPALAARVSAAELWPCWAVLVTSSASWGLPFTGAFVRRAGSAVAWVARARPVDATTTEGWVLHASAEWSQANLEARPEDVCAQLVRAAEVAIGRALPPAVHVDAHRWRYARPRIAVGEPCLFDPGSGLGYASDACLDGRVEAAFTAGRTLADRVLARS